MATKQSTTKNDVEMNKSHPQSKEVTTTTIGTSEVTDVLPDSSSASDPDTPNDDVREGDLVVVETSQDEMCQQRRSCYVKITLAALLVAFITFVIIDSQTNQHIRNGITAFLEWIEENPGAGVVAFMLVYFVATILFIPGSILTLGAGFVFSASFGSLGVGILLGVISVFFGACGGAIISFLLGRYLLRDAVGRLSKKYSVLDALDKALAEKGLRIMILLRLSPIIPFNAVNYVAGVTAISFWSYVVALLAIIPGTALYVFLGASAGSLTESANSGENATVTIIVVVVGIIFGVLAIALTSYYARQELNKVVANRQAEIEDDHRQIDEEAGAEFPPVTQVEDLVAVEETVKESTVHTATG
jgi:uncharacterized membrane protein YdjX (TVP38/TMEM64 family)